MAELEIGPRPFDGLYWNSCLQTPAKLGRLVMAGPDNWHALIDLDGCMTTEDLDSYDVMHGLLSDKAKARDIFLNESYYPLHKRGLLEDYDAARWWIETMENFVGDNILLADVEEGAKDMTARPGLFEYLDLLKNLGVPAFVVSGGIGNTVRPFLRHNGIDPDKYIAGIAANWFEANEDGSIKLPEGWEPTHINNKNEAAQGNGALAAARQNRPFVVITGDGSKDPQMATGDNVTSFCVGLPPRLKRGLPPKTQLRERRAFRRERLEQGYDAISRGGDFWPITRSVGQLALLHARLRSIRNSSHRPV